MLAPLSERDALQILQTHCGVLRGRLVFDASREDGALIKQVWMSLLCLKVSDDELTHGLGYELRVAIDIVNALCACAGFSPDRNHRFWRMAVSELWIEYPEDKHAYDPRRTRFEDYLFQPPSHMMLPFDRAAFSCFSIDFQEYPASGSETALAELWRQVTWSDAVSKCPDWIMERRRVVMKQLWESGCVVRSIRTLHLELIVPANSTTVPYHHEPPNLTACDWSAVTVAVNAIGQDTYARAVKLPTQKLLTEVTREPAIASRQELSIAFHPDWMYCFYLHSSNLQAVRQLLCGCRFVKCLTLDVQLVREADTTNQARLFGELLHALVVETKTLKTLRLLKWVTKHMIAAVGSVLPVASSLESLLISSVDATDRDLESQWDWLEYGLSHPLRRDMNFPELMLSVDDTKMEDADVEARLETARRSKHPLKAVIQETVIAGDAQASKSDVWFEWYAMDTAVARVVVEFTRVYLDPSLRGRPIAHITMGTEFEAVVCVTQLGVVGVVVRGYGLCWVRGFNVDIDGGTAPSACERGGQEARLFALTAASVRHLPGLYMSAPRPSGMPILWWLDGAKLQSLALVGFEKNPRQVVDTLKLKLVLQSCPNLKTLLLESYGVSSLQPLVDAYARKTRPCQIASLSIVAGWAKPLARATQCRPLLTMLSNPNHPGARVVCHLSLVATNLGAQRPHFRAKDVARMLETNLVLESVYAAAADRDDRSSSEWNESTRMLLERFQDQVLEDCTRVSLGLLSAVNYYGAVGTQGIAKRTRYFQRHCAVGCLNGMLVQHIMSFVGATRVRCMRWTCDQTLSMPSWTVDRKTKYRL